MQEPLKGGFVHEGLCCVVIIQLPISDGFGSELTSDAEMHLVALRLDSLARSGRCRLVDEWFGTECHELCNQMNLRSALGTFLSGMVHRAAPHAAPGKSRLG